MRQKRTSIVVTGIACLLAVAQLAAGGNGGEPLIIGDVSQRVLKITQLAETSPTFRRGIHEGIPSSNTLVLRPSTTRDPTVNATLARWVRNGLEFTGIVPDAVASTVRTLDSGTIVRGRFLLPDMPLGQPDRQRQKVSITIWICDSREEAIALFWLRRGGQIPSEAVVPDDLRLGARSKLWSDDGEVHYKLQSQLGVSIPLPAADPRAGADRVGILNGNVLIEATGSTFFVNSAGQWVTTGMSPQDESFLIDLLRATRRAMDNSL